MMPDPQMPVTPIDAVAAAKPSSSDQRSLPITLKRGSSVIGVDPQPLNRTGRGTLTARNLRTFESRSGRRGGRQQRGAIAQYDFGIGADVDNQRHVVAKVRLFRQDHTGSVGAHMARNAWQHVDPCVCVDAVRSTSVAHTVMLELVAKRKWRAAQLNRVNAEIQVMHDRVADHGDVEHIGRVNVGFFDDVLGQLA